MIVESLNCTGCPHVFGKGDNIDFQARRAICPDCGAIVFFERSKINKTEGVVYNVENAVRFFEEKNFDSANKFAEQALSVSFDNIVGLFIIAYYKAFCASEKSFSQLNKFFYEEFPTIRPDEDEMEAFKKLMLKCVLHVSNYEEQILAKIVETQQDNAIAGFVESFSPHLIKRRNSIDWFTPTMKDIYAELTKRANIPATWLALYKQISTNPDSPEPDNTFFLKTKTRNFYDNYVLGVGEIFNNIQDEGLKAKFKPAFDQKNQFYISNMK